MGLFCFGAYHYLFKVWLFNYTNHNQEIEIPDLTAMDIDEAVRTLEELKLTYEIDSIRFDSSSLPNSIIDFFPEAGFKVKEGRKIFIKANPKGWMPTTLPDIVGKSRRLAMTQLKLSGLEIGDTIYEADIAKDAVLRVMFKGKQITKGTELPRFTKVDLVLGRGIEYGVKMKNLVGLTLEEARSSIYAGQFEVGRLLFEGPVTDSSKLIVFYQYPLSGDNYDQGLPVDLWLSEKSEKDLRLTVKDLDLQFRNFGENDSLAAAKYMEEFKLTPKEENEQMQKEPDFEPSSKPVEKPQGMEID